MTPKQRVLEAYPEAHAVQDLLSGWWRIRDGYKLLTLDFVPTARAAWQDAARRLKNG